MVELSKDEFNDLLCPMLADPKTRIEDGKFLALAEGGGLFLNGRGFQLHGAAMGNTTLLTLLACLNKGRVLTIKYDRRALFSDTDAGQYPLLMAAIADFYGVRHNFDRNKYRHNYEAVAQRIYGYLRDAHPDYSPPERIYRHPGLWFTHTFQWTILIYCLIVLLIYLGNLLGNQLTLPTLVPRSIPWVFALIFGGYALDHFLSWWHYDAPRLRLPSGKSASQTGPTRKSPPEPPYQQPPPPPRPPGPASPSSRPASSIPPPQAAADDRFDLEPPLLPTTPIARMDERQQAILQEITEVARLLDSAFNIPVINKSFGVDPLLGTVWGLGNVVSFLPATYIILRSASLGLPSYKLVRMLRNTLIDTGVGLIPIVGQATDFFIKANISNLNIIHEHFGLPRYKRPR